MSWGPVTPAGKAAIADQVDALCKAIIDAQATLTATRKALEGAEIRLSRLDRELTQLGGDGWAAEHRERYPCPEGWREEPVRHRYRASRLLISEDGRRFRRLWRLDDGEAEVQEGERDDDHGGGTDETR